MSACGSDVTFDMRTFVVLTEFARKFGVFRLDAVADIGAFVVFQCLDGHCQYAEMRVNPNVGIYRVLLEVYKFAFGCGGIPTVEFLATFACGRHGYYLTALVDGNGCFALQRAAVGVKCHGVNLYPVSIQRFVGSCFVKHRVISFAAFCRSVPSVKTIAAARSRRRVQHKSVVVDFHNVVSVDCAAVGVKRNLRFGRSRRSRLAFFGVVCVQRHVGRHLVAVKRNFVAAFRSGKPTVERVVGFCRSGCGSNGLTAFYGNRFVTRERSAISVKRHRVLDRLGRRFGLACRKGKANNHHNDQPKRSKQSFCFHCLSPFGFFRTDSSFRHNLPIYEHILP